MKLKLLLGIIGFLALHSQAALYTIGGTTSGPNADLTTYSWSIDGKAETGLAGTIRLDPVVASGGKSIATVCTDVSAILWLGNPYTFSDPRSFSQVGSGSDPGWGKTSGDALKAIQNAAFIFYTHQDWLNGDSAQKAAVQLAVWGALYDTGGSLNLYDSKQRFSVVGDSDAKVLAQSLLGSLATADTSAFGGSLLQPLLPGGSVDKGAQEVFAPVPEPSTILAGLLLIVPVGASIARRFQRKA